VLAAEGLVLVDGGHEWMIVAIEEGGVVARLGASTRRFKAGTTVATVGRQRGSLRLPESSSPSATSVRAYDRLRQLREQLRNGKPAYVVFHDATLEHIALELPTSLAALRRIDGVGPVKLEQYGDAVLLAIEDATNPTGPDTAGLD
jgi:superfamily II DNA helicase RecQ